MCKHEHLGALHPFQPAGNDQFVVAFFTRIPFSAFLLMKYFELFHRQLQVEFE